MMKNKTKTKVAATPTHTPNWYDPLWIEAINGVLEDRDSDVRIDDLDNGFWERFIGPMIDAIEDGEELK